MNKNKKLSKNNFWSFEWLVRTSPFNLVLLMIVFPCLFIVWLFKIGQLSEKKLSLKPDYLFRFLLFVFSFGMILIVASFFGESLFNLDKHFDYVFFPFYFCFIYIDFYITKLTFKVENKDKYRSDFADRAGRFIILSTLIFGVFLLQPTMNRLFHKG